MTSPALVTCRTASYRLHDGRHLSPRFAIRLRVPATKTRSAREDCNVREMRLRRPNSQPIMREGRGSTTIGHDQDEVAFETRRRTPLIEATEQYARRDFAKFIEGVSKHRRLVRIVETNARLAVKRTRCDASHRLDC